MGISVAKIHKVKVGECLSSIAADYGLLPDTIWLHPENAIIRSERASGNVLHVGDALYIPDIQIRLQKAAIGQRHTFRRKAVPEILRLYFHDQDDNPRANTPYRLFIDGAPRKGLTDAEGLLEEPIAPDAKAGTLYLGGTDEDMEEYQLQLGHLPPDTTIEGVQARLWNLDFYHGERDGKLNEATRIALANFQLYYELNVSGELDESTLDKLNEVHLS
jgi:N-acetylmuramoyl-L-alanine amidase